MKLKRYSREWLQREIERFHREIDRKSKLLAGKMKVVSHHRRAYSERKIRRYEATVVRRIVPLDYEPKRRKK